MMILFCCFACYSVRALRWVLGGAATSCGLWRFFRPTFAEHDMLFSILLSSDALYVFSINQPQHTCGQKTPTLEQICCMSYHLQQNKYVPAQSSFIAFSRVYQHKAKHYVKAWCYLCWYSAPIVLFIHGCSSDSGFPCQITANHNIGRGCARV